MAKRIFLASDLSSKRREVIDEARSGVAQIRDTDGTALVMLGQGNFAFLRALRDLLPELLRIEVAMALPPSERS
ncbi:MAG TPA: hypothetical protein VIA18_20100, partial [Polyangia bacterium]|nr:hypothetical protein [Polyangia bacterium]